VFVKRFDPESKRVSVGLDFTFNALRNVHRVEWKPEAPDYSQVTDGLTWFAYCKNPKCKIYKKLFTVAKCYGIFKMSKDVQNINCPTCGL
jgi:hypothetical protein